MNIEILETESTTENIVIDMSKVKQENKPFNPDYVHTYDPEGDKPDSSSKSVKQLLDEETSEDLIKSSEAKATEKIIKSDFEAERALLDKLKCVFLHRMNKHPLTHFIDLQPFEKKIFKSNIEKDFYKILNSEELQNDITTEFNDIVQNIILSEKSDVSKYPVYDRK